MSGQDCITHKFSTLMFYANVSNKKAERINLMFGFELGAYLVSEGRLASLV
ncbi:hypothetical protein SAMN05660649_04453 [Desulfotomaculum arcticum]|uniref:Uncharacterized protein n=1 Tax=Desulfotruncus arcticus DSM 17038 TaxID=1121424 RepID=A0A1I2YKI9_9FIRM|nr:hypothetical protein SAMN05660649_04453 [Desulfotomaculum arcticum] [Desulfotruncus arcticus DSM 17038]